jgi:hypothetical protein
MDDLPRITKEMGIHSILLAAVRGYLDLMNGSGQYVFGSGVNTVFSLVRGAGTLNDEDIHAITKKAASNGMSAGGVDQFALRMVALNAYAWGRLVEDRIMNRLNGIANGYVPDVIPTMRTNPIRARRFYYFPPAPVLKETLDALDKMSPKTLQDAANTASYQLADAYAREGVISRVAPSYATTTKCVAALVEVLSNVAQSDAPVTASMLRDKSYQALRILWVIAKFLSGDLSPTPARHEYMEFDLLDKIDISDGTLLAIPLPTEKTIKMFCDEGRVRGMTALGRRYASLAMRAAVFRDTLRDTSF